MDLISDKFLSYQPLGGFVGTTGILLKDSGEISFEVFSKNSTNVERGFAVENVVVPTLLGMPRMLGNTSTLKLNISNKFVVEVGRKQGFYLTSGEFILAEHLHVGDNLMGITPDMMGEVFRGAEFIHAYMGNAYFKVAAIAESSILKEVFGLTSPRHGRFILANGLLAKAEPKIERNRHDSQ